MFEDPLPRALRCGGGTVRLYASAHDASIDPSACRVLSDRGSEAWVGPAAASIPMVQQDWKSLGSYGSLGLELALSVILPLYAGRWLDGQLGTSPWLAFLAGALGLAAGVRSIVSALRRANREALEADSKSKD